MPVKWILRFFTGIAIGVIYYLVFSIFFDTPMEHELKTSTRKIEEEYRELEERYDTLKTILDNVAERDRSIYNILFEAEPDAGTDEEPSRKLALYGQLDSMTIIELNQTFEERLDRLFRQVTMYNADVRLRMQQARENSADVLTIPSIQPVDNKQLTQLTASFGERVHPFYKTMSQHEGVDYSVPVGTAVFVTADGTVKSMVTKGQTSGLSITIDHGNGYETVYSHLYKVVAQPGKRVSRGDIIAFSGSSGLSFAPHLHYEVRYKGEALDPLNYFFMELDAHQMERLRAISKMGMQSFD